MTFENALSHGKELLKSAGVVDYELDAWYLLEYVCKYQASSS